MSTQNANIITGLIPNLSKEGDKNNYVTSVILALPFIQDDFEEGNFEVEYEGYSVDIEIFKVTDKNQDPILSSLNNTKLNKGITISSDGLILPNEMCTDNRGKYPYYCVKINFPFLLEDWIDTTNNSCPFRQIDSKRAQVSGGHKYEDKINALYVLNELFSSESYNVRRLLEYDDVTLFIENYLSIHTLQLVFQRICLFTSKDAYKNALDYFFGSSSEDCINSITQEQKIPNIQNETDFLEYILYVIEEISHFVENRRWIDPFWNGKRRVKKDGKYLKIDGKYIEVPAEPKSETGIQTTLDVLFHLMLNRFRITVDRETDEGIGKLDFKFRYETVSREPLTLCLEFKLAHNKKFKHGLSKQLPAYLKANRSNIGIFVVMWFKDGNFFKEPTDKTKIGMSLFLENTANSVNKTEGFNIRTVVIDASIKNSASNL